MRSTNKIFFCTPLVLQTAIWPITRPILWFFLRLRISGLENLKNLPKGVIFAANHSSELDPVLLPASLPFLSRFMPIFYVSRPKSFYNNSGWRQFLYGGFFFKLWGAHSAISGHKDYGVALSPHVHIIQRRRSLLIFPEGKKTQTGEVVPENAHGGVIFLAEKTGLPIAPVHIRGVFKMSMKDFILRRRNVSLTFGRPIYTKEIFNSLNKNDRSSNLYKLASRKLLEIVACI